MAVFVVVVLAAADEYVIVVLRLLKLFRVRNVDHLGTVGCWGVIGHQDEVGDAVDCGKSVHHC